MTHKLAKLHVLLDVSYFLWTKLINTRYNDACDEIKTCLQDTIQSPWWSRLRVWRTSAGDRLTLTCSDLRPSSSLAEVTCKQPEVETAGQRFTHSSSWWAARLRNRTKLQHHPPHYWDQNHEQPLSCEAKQEETDHKIKANITDPAQIHPSGVFICKEFQISGASTALVVLCVGCDVQSAVYDMQLHSECHIHFLSLFQTPPLDPPLDWLLVQFSVLFWFLFF